MSAHAEWEELAAGYALNALEPGDEQAFTAHLRGCDRCRRDLAELREVTGQLAYAADPAEPPADLGARIMSAAAAERPDAFHTVTPIEAAPSRRAPRGLAPLAFAAAAVLVVFALGVWNVVLRDDVRTRDAVLASRTAALACLARADAATYKMNATDGQHATVCLDATEAYVVADRLDANNPRSVYVLWWLDDRSTPHAVERFDVVQGGSTPAVVALPLSVRPGDVRSMAVSLEPSRVLPDKPTKIVVSAEAPPAT